MWAVCTLNYYIFINIFIKYIKGFYNNLLIIINSDVAYISIIEEYPRRILQY